jgi:hypothetical protein
VQLVYFVQVYNIHNKGIYAMLSLEEFLVKVAHGIQSVAAEPLDAIDTQMCLLLQSGPKKSDDEVPDIIVVNNTTYSEVSKLEVSAVATPFTMTQTIPKDDITSSGDNRSYEDLTSESEVVSSIEYPNGNQSYQMCVPVGVLPKQLCSVGWATLVFYQKDKDKNGNTIVKKSCLGNYVCPVTGCNITERPRLPKVVRKCGALPRPPQTFCKKHDTKLIHSSCTATVEFTCSKTEVLMIHKGFHYHAKPHPIRPSLSASIDFKSVVAIAAEATPKQLLVGTSSRQGVGNLHEAYNNLDRLAYHKRKILKPFNLPSTIGSLANFNKNIQVNFIRSSSFQAHDGHITMQTDSMIQQLKCNELPFESDSVEGFVFDDESPNVNVTFTSGFHVGIGRTVPFLISILFGKTEHHYAAHFCRLFQSLGYASFDDFHNAFPGNTSDFSDAERTGFKTALNKVFPESESHSLEEYYRFCEVHFYARLSACVEMVP